MNETTEQKIHTAFIIGLILKGINAILETVLGIVFLFSNITALVVTLIQNELVEDPTDFLAGHMRHLIPQLSSTGQKFAAFYLLFHGILKLLLVIGLLQKRLWVYPATIVVLGLFIIYQLLRYTHTHSLFLILLSLFDGLMIYLTWHEYQYYEGKLMKK